MKTAVFHETTVGELVGVNVELVTWFEQVGQYTHLHLDSQTDELIVAENVEEVANGLRFGWGGLTILRTANQLIDEVHQWIEAHDDLDGTAALSEKMKELADLLDEAVDSVP